MGRGISRRTLLVGAGLGALAAGGLGLAYWRDGRRLSFVSNLGGGGDHVDDFRNMDRIFPTRTFRRGANVSPLAAGSAIDLPATFASAGRDLDTTKFLDETDTTGLLVLADGKVALERYWRGNGPDTRWISWSVGKSFISALVGIAVEEKAIASLDDPLTRYAPEFAGTGYDGVTVRHALTMSSGVRWNEDYSDPQSDVHRFGRAMAMGESMNDFARTLVRAHAPGTVMHYNSMDAQTLGLVLLRATGMNPSAYLEDRIWSRIGVENDGYWLLDGAGNEFAAGGVNVTLRDYARFGQLYLNEGAHEGKSVIPAAWVRASHDPDAPHLKPPARTAEDPGLGYGYLWWVPKDVDGPYMAIGIFNQFVYVDPRRRIVIAKTSASRNYMSGNSDRVWREGETLDFFTALAEAAA